MTTSKPETSAEENSSVIGRWLLLLSGGAWLLALIQALGTRVPWPVGYTIMSGVFLLLSLIAPLRFRTLAFNLVLVIVISCWSKMLWQAIILQIGLVGSQQLTYEQVDILTDVMGLLTGLISVGGLLTASLFFASEFVLAFRGAFGMTRREALRALASVGFGLQYPYMIVEDGKATITKPKGLLPKIGGPGLVIIRPANAVVFERMGKVTQVAGPGKAYTKLFEFDKKVVQLRPRWVSFKADDVATQDGVPLKLEGGVGARIEPASVTEERIKSAGGPEKYEWASQFREVIGDDFPVYQDSVFRAVYLPSGPDWEITLGAATEALIRDAVGQRRLKDIYGAPASGLPDSAEREIEAIEQQTLTALQRFVSTWGVMVTGVEIRVLEPPADVQQRVLKQWQIAADSQAIQDLGQAEAKAVRAVGKSQADSFQSTVQQLQAAVERASNLLDEEPLQRFQELLEMMVATMGRDSTAALRYVEAMEKLCQHPNARIVIGPPGQQMNIEQHQ